MSAADSSHQGSRPNADIDPYASAQVIVALDFGSAFSGFAWGLRSNTDAIHNFSEWPALEAAGGERNCKTKTSLWYKRGTKPGSFDLQAWGYTAVVKYAAAVQARNATIASRRNRKVYSTRRAELLAAISSVLSDDSDLQASVDHDADESDIGMDLEKEVGYLMMFFKPLLAEDSPSLSLQAKIPEGLTVERMISDFLREMGSLALKVVQSSLARHITKADVLWCLAVPGIWGEAAKQKLKTCMEIAGLVRGPACVAKCASPFPVTLVLEPDAASVYCRLHSSTFHFNPQVKLLVIDMGCVIVDLKVHQKIKSGNAGKVHQATSSSHSTESTQSCDIGSSTSSGPAQKLKMREVAMGTGGYCGGSILDDRFIQFLCKRIPGYYSIAKAFPESILKITSRWETLKHSFQGTEEIPFQLELPARLAKAWEDNDQREGVTDSERKRRRQTHWYDALTISIADMTSIFQASLTNIMGLVKGQINKVPDLHAIVVVGGFSASPYIKRKLTEAFGDKVPGSVIFPDNPEGATCLGAVVTTMVGAGLIVSRFARKTYGISITRPSRKSDPVDLLIRNPSCPAQNTRSKRNGITRKHKKRQSKSRSLASLLEPARNPYCRDAFDVFCRKGDEVPHEYRVTRKYVALTDTHESTRIDLYSSTTTDPKYVTVSSVNDGQVKKEGTFVIHHPSTADLGYRPSFLVSMFFGRTSIEVTAQGLNFGPSGTNTTNKLVVRFEHHD